MSNKVDFQEHEAFRVFYKDGRMWAEENRQVIKGIDHEELDKMADDIKAKLSSAKEEKVTTCDVSNFFKDWCPAIEFVPEYARVWLFQKAISSHLFPEYRLNTIMMGIIMCLVKKRPIIDESIKKTMDEELAKFTKDEIVEYKLDLNVFGGSAA